MTFVKYGTQKALVPYLLNGNSQYSAVAPVINASEVTREFPASWWDSEKIPASPYRYIDNDVDKWTLGTGVYENSSASGQDNIFCTTAGTMYIPSTQAYGTWEFELYKSGSSNNIIIWYMADNPVVSNGYRFLFDASERVKVFSQISGAGVTKFATIAGYFSNGTWYSVRITRTALGVTNTYIKNGAFGNIWILVASAQNPFTENTVTTSTYFVVDNDYGDRISNVRFKDDYKTIIK